LFIADDSVGLNRNRSWIGSSKE